MKFFKRITAAFTAAMLAVLVFAVNVLAASAPKAKLNKTNISVAVGETYYLYVNGAVENIS